MPIAVAVETVVGPAMAPADRRTPERLAPDRADHAADYRAGRTGYQQARAGTGRCADHVGVGARRRQCCCHRNDCRCHKNLTHEFLLQATRFRSHRGEDCV